MALLKVPCILLKSIVTLSSSITATLQASTNYNAAKDKMITVYVEKKNGYKVDVINKNYLYMNQYIVVFCFSYQSKFR